MHTLTLTPLAARLIAATDARRSTPQLSTLNSQLSTSPSDWISAPEAAKLTGYSRRHIQRLCEQGFFKMGEEWKQRPPMPGSDQGGWIRIKRSALKKLEGS